MMRKIPLTLVLFTISSVVSRDHSYCKLDTCPNRTHTFCKYPVTVVSRKCCQAYFPGLGSNEIEQIINMHNEASPSLILHKLQEISETENDTTNPITVQYPMEWDEELKEIAQRWANQCPREVDECRNVDRFKVQQQVASLSSSIHERPPGIMPLVSQFISDGRDNWDSLHFKDLSIENIADTVSSHVGRFKWRTANKIGCGLVRAYDKLFQFVHLVCNYGPV